MSITEAKDPYRRRREAGDDSRRRTQVRLVQAADRLFREHGYAATTVTAIAREAGVSLQTLYLAWGSKREVFRAAASAAASGSESPDWSAAVHDELADAGGADPDTVGYLTALAHVLVAVTGRTTVYRRLYREAAVVEPALADDWATVQAQTEEVLRSAVAELPPGALRPDLSPDTIFLTVWALASPELYDAVTVRAHRTPAQFQTWLTDTLISALTRPQD